MTGLSPAFETMNWAGTSLNHAVWHATVDGALTIMVLWLVLRLVRCAPARLECWLWRAVVVKMLVSLVWSGAVVLPVLPVSLLPTGPNKADLSSPLYRHDHVSLFSGPSAALFLLWCIGMGVATFRTARAWSAARSLRGNAAAAESAAAARLLNQLCCNAGMKRKPDLVVSCQIDSPLLVGFAYPAIVLPSGLIDRFSEIELRMVLLHELAHLRRRDLAWSWLSALIGAVFFFHPFVWLARRRLALACEVACDEEAVGSTPALIPGYLAVLLKVATRSEGSLRPSFAAAPMVEPYMPLRHRFLAMKSAVCVSCRRRLVSGLAACIVGGVPLLPWHLSPRSAAAIQPPSSASPAEPDTKPTAEAPVEIILGSGGNVELDRAVRPVRRTMHFVRLRHEDGAELMTDAVVPSEERIRETVESSTDQGGRRLVRSTWTFDP